MTNVIVALRNFAIAPKNASQIFVKYNILMCCRVSDLSGFVYLLSNCVSVGCDKLLFHERHTHTHTRTHIFAPFLLCYCGFLWASAVS
jgi:hypothetical protein